MKYGISEILAQVESESKLDKKIEILRKNDSSVLRDIIKLAFDKNLKWDLPEGKPPFNPNKFPGNQPNLYASWRRMYLFFPNGGGNLSTLKRETLFIQFLEQLDPADADLICAVKDKQMPYKITKNQFEKAFPGMFNYSTEKTE